MPATPPVAARTDGPLLAEFPPAGYDDWKSLVTAELKGAPFDKKMFSTTYEGITLRPIYRPEDVADVPHLGSYPGFAPYVRGTRAGGYLSQPWQVSQEIAIADPAAFNDAARAALQRGLTALNVVLDRATRNGADPDWADPEAVGRGGLSIATLADLGRALDGIDLAAVPLFIRSGASGMPLASLLVALARSRGVDPALLRGCIEVDPLGVLAHEGRLAQSLDAAYGEMAALTAWSATHAPQLRTLCVHGRAWHEAGGHAVQELAFVLATALEYFRAMNQRGLGIDVVAPRIRLALTVGSRFFVEIAKLRAARILWSRLVGVLGGNDASRQASLHVRTNLFDKTVRDPYVNLLRTSVGSFAAVLGGCDSLQIGPFDEVVRSPDEFSQRMARNQQLILRDECHLAQVVDPAGGSWFVESLTAELASRAWALFQDIERQGGMTRSMRAGWPQKEVAKVAEERLANVARRRDGIVGTNVYPNVQEKPLEPSTEDPAAFRRARIQQVAQARTAAEDDQNRRVLDRLAAMIGKHEAALFDACVEAVVAGASLGEVTRAVRIQDRPDDPITPVCLTRAAVGFERLRGAMDRHAASAGRRPKVFLATMGPPKQHRARAEFSRAFFEVGGFEVVLPAGFKTVEEAAAAARDSGASVVCVCSTDETYPELVGPLVKAIRASRPGMPVILAGYPPEQVEAHKAAGIDDFIHLRANTLELLTSIAARLGVTA